MGENKQQEQLSASVIMSSEVVTDLYCEFCNEDGERVQAEWFCVDCSDYMCIDCSKVHRKTRVTRHHQLQDKTAMPQTKPHQPQNPLPSINQAPKNAWTESCELHPEETIKFYCRDHRVLGCCVCMTFGHRACGDMKYIRDITSDLLASQEYKSFEKELTAMKAKSQALIKNSKENISKAEKCYEEANTAFQQQRNDIIKAFDKLGKDVKNQTETLKNADVKNMKAISEKGTGFVSEIEKIKFDICKLQENDQLCQLFITMKRANSKLEIFREVLQTAEKENFVKTYKFEPGAQIRQIMNSPPTALGRITIETPAAETAQEATAGEAFPIVSADTMSHIQPSPQATTAIHQRNITVKTATGNQPARKVYPVVPDDTLSHIQPAPEATAAVHQKDITLKTATDKQTAREAYPAVPADKTSHIQPAPQDTSAVHKRDITVKTATDSRTCYITGSALLPSNRLVLTDWTNYKVKLVNLQNAKAITELKTDKSPWDLTAITADQVAVTVPRHQEILFVKVVETLSIDRKMKVNGDCRGIVYGGSKLFVTFEHPGKIEILTLDGVLERRVDRDALGYDLFAWPLHIALSPDCKTLYVSDCNNNNIKRFTLDGSVLVVYKDKKMTSPAGLVVDQLGRVIVCITTSRNIHLLNLDCTKVKVLLSGLSFPTSLCFSQQTGLLYVGQNNAVVKVYQLS